MGIVLDSQPLGWNVAPWEGISSQHPNWNHDMHFNALDIFPIFLLVANTPQSWGFSASVRQRDCSGSEGLGCRVGATLERWSGRDKETAVLWTAVALPGWAQARL